MPISLRATDNTEFSTQATMTLVNLYTHRTAAVRRLLAIRDAAGAAKALAGRTKSILPTDFPSIAAPWLLHGLATLYGWSGLADKIVPIANVVISHVPGPQVPLYAAGACMCTYWPLSIPEHDLGLNITVMSYAGAMRSGFTAARAAHRPCAGRSLRRTGRPVEAMCRAQYGCAQEGDARRREAGPGSTSLSAGGAGVTATALCPGITATDTLSTVQRESGALRRLPPGVSGALVGKLW